MLACSALGFSGRLGCWPCFLSGLLGLPLRLFAYGVGLFLRSYRSISVPPVRGAPTFLCLPQRKVGKRKRLKPLTIKWVSWLGGGSGASGICVLAHSALVTRPSFFRWRCARRKVLQKTIGSFRIYSCLRVRVVLRFVSVAPVHILVCQLPHSLSTSIRVHLALLLPTSKLFIEQSRDVT
jgi:hypothetical protein